MGLYRLGYRCVLCAGFDPAFVPYQRAVLLMNDESRTNWCPSEELNPDLPLTRRLHRRNASRAWGADKASLEN
jgi:hypothetical protein